ncbi:MAG: hypothetical protein HY567_01235 [Candidatus Kerfeldbacteria bacterium]|nr:hypothetical protein [Candidatus Kerfeldbacteria bacterium]
MATKFVVTSEQKDVIDRRMAEIKRQLEQESGSPLDPDTTARALQQIIEGVFGVPGLVGDAFEMTVNYDDPQWSTIDRDRYAYVGDVKVKDYPITEKGTKPVRFRLLEFDHDPLDQEVLDRMAQLNCRQPDRAESETVIRRHTSEQIREHPVIGLIGPAVQRGGGLDRAYVFGDEVGVKLYWDWTDFQWGRYCRFVAVCK